MQEYIKFNVINKICHGSISLYQFIKNHYKLQYISDFEDEFLIFLHDTLISFPSQEKQFDINSIPIEYTSETQIQLLKRIITNTFSNSAPNQNNSNLNVICFGYKRTKNVNKGKKYLKKKKDKNKNK